MKESMKKERPKVQGLRIKVIRQVTKMVEVKEL